ncbi:SusC/RagA family TonB-linked outer membrane protein [Chitinophagaceae bacterium LB-8]|uniref:SusC/RagA family TonB-linked outer membrane protein n=1 Tax=Paraflavisolibacter caeni TaxID=2982496 RepID=A0A9X3BH21_9BACT|nr:SusC/RagA family TonB-linked outer membrane protein [Paraflavisolibacter caeni]MCU7548812.1 SusC/RagA family TonB-linked outer membrane protein [Paraflavisolibacter caeni]
MFLCNKKLKSKPLFFSALTRCYLLLLPLVLVFVQAGAQERTIEVLNGVVKSERGEILTGATVVVRNTKLATSTGKDGSFVLKNVPSNATLRVSFVGHTAKEVKLKDGQRSIEILLSSNSNTLADVVVNTGLYRRPTGNFTGAAKSFSGEQLKSVNPANVLQALAVVEPALRIVENNAMGNDPNQLPIIQLRGQNNLPVSSQGTLEGATPVSNGDMMSSYLLNPNQPLIILDGFQTTLQAINDMDINRIASITVLKDAAATVAYGSKAANGVIVVETKQPLSGKMRISYGINASVELPDLSSYHLMDAKQFLEAQRLAGIYGDPANHYNDVALKQWYDYRLQQVQSGVNTYWLSQPLRTGYALNHSLNLEGGTGNIRHSLSLNYGSNNGVMKGSGRTSYGLNYNLTYVFKNIRFSNVTSVSSGRGDNSPWGSFSEYAKQYPYFRPYNSEGQLNKIFEPSAAELGIALAAPGGIITNAMYNSTLNVVDYSNYLSYSNATNFDWNVTRDLRLKANVRLSNNLPEGEQFLPADHTVFVKSVTSRFVDLGSYSQMKGKNTSVDGRISLDYNKRFGRHTIYSALGFSAQQTNSTSTTVKTTGIPNDFLGDLGLANGYGLNYKPTSLVNNTRSVSQFLSVSYNYNDRYTAEATLNSSGSSQFGSNNRFAPFWAGGIAWNVDKEKFFKRNFIIQQLRLKANTGVTGNQNFAASMAQPFYNYNTQNNYRLQLGSTINTYANPNLKWQQTLKNNLSVQMSLLNEHVMVGADFYLEKTNSLILPLDVAPSTGFDSYQDNLGAVENRGYEVSLGLPIIRNRAKNIFWSLSFNTGSYENVITKLSPAIEAYNKENDKIDNSEEGKKKQQKPLPRFVVGQAMNTIWAVRSLGIDPATGKEVFLKLDGSKTFNWDPNDKFPVAVGDSKFKGMIGSNLTLKSFTFNFNLAYQLGGYKYNQTLADKIENVNLNLTNADSRVLTDRWKKPGDVSSYKALVTDGGGNTLLMTQATSRFVQRDNFIDASSVTVGYNFPANLKWVRLLKLSTPKIFITQNQVFRLGTIEAERGTAYPFTRRFNFGLSSTF